MRAALRNLARGLREEVRADLVDEGVLEGLAVILGDGLAPAGNSGPVGPFRELVGVFSTCLLRCSISPLTCSRNVRSMVSTTGTPLMTSRAAVIASH
jgi:hypothetical protein